MDIPYSIKELWYTGQVLVCYKDAVFEGSSPRRYATKLPSILIHTDDLQRCVLYLYSDGGPEDIHVQTYTSVQVSLIALFLKLDLDVICAVRTAPSHSSWNRVEWVKLTLNLGLQCA